MDGPPAPGPSQDWVRGRGWGARRGSRCVGGPRGGCAGGGAGVLYHGGGTVVEAAPAIDPGTTLSLSLESSDACVSGATIHLALIDGWVIPNGE